MKYFVNTTTVQMEPTVRFPRQKLKNFILLTATCSCQQQYKGDAFLRFHGSNGYMKAPQCYVIRTLSALWSNP